MDRISILIADDTLIAREGWKKILETEEGIEIVGEAHNALETLTKVKDLRPDVLLIDLMWFGDETAGAEAIARIKRESPQTKVVAITAYRHLIADARRAGAEAALPKGFSRSELVGIIRAAHNLQPDSASTHHTDPAHFAGIGIGSSAVFVSYSHKDEKEKDELLSHLGVLEGADLIDLWSDDRISAGADWETEISQAISKAEVAILLISANFLTSRFILEKEVRELLKRRDREGLTVFPVIAKPCAWREVGWLAKMNVRPKNGNPVWSDGGSHVDEDLAAIAEEVADIVRRKG